MGLFGLWLAVCAIAGALATNWALHPPRKHVNRGEEHVVSIIGQRNHAIFYDAVAIADDGSQLRGWFIRNSHGNGDSVILLHGQSDNRAGMLGPAEMFLQNGYSVLLLDARAQGESGGKEVTYGVFEAGDLQKWYDWLQETSPSKCIFGLGDSMGAAELLQSLRRVNGFCAVVAESPFASFREAAYDRIGQWTGTGPWMGRTFLRPVIWFGLLYANMHYGIDLASSNPGQAVAAARVPVMLIHGLRDDNLPPRHSEEILNEVHNKENVTLWEPPDAGHCGASAAEPDEYAHRVLSWFAVHDHPEIR